MVSVYFSSLFIENKAKKEEVNINSLKKKKSNLLVYLLKSKTKCQIKQKSSKKIAKSTLSFTQNQLWINYIL